MSNVLKRFCLALCVLVVLFASTAGAETKKEKADKLYKEGVELLKNGDVEGAAKLFKKAVEIKRSAPLLFNLGQATAKLGRLTEAKELLIEARTEAEKNGPPAMVDLSANALKALDSRFPRITVELPTGVKDADVQVDGKKLESSSDGMQVEPGSHELSVAASGYERYTETFQVKEGEKRKLSPKLEPDLGSGTAPVKRDKPDEEPTRDKKSFPIGPVVLGGVGLVALGGATYMFLKVKSVDKERRELWQDSGCPGPSCPNGEPDDAATLRESSESKARVGNILLGAGAACIVGAGVWLYFSSKGGNKEQARIGVMPTLGGVVVSGQL